MSGLDQLQYLSWLLYLFVFVAVLVRTIRRPTPAHLDMTLFFGAVAVLIVLASTTSKLHVPASRWITALIWAAGMSLGYLLLRLVRDFSDVPSVAMRAVEAGLVISVLAIIILPAPLPTWLALVLVAYLVVEIACATLAFARQATRTRGVTRRRMQAAAAGSLTLALALITAGFGVGLSDLANLVAELGAVLGLASGAFYFVAFAPPTWLRHAWQEPELRAFLAVAGSLPHLPDLRSIVRELERSAAAALGAPAASIALWDADTRCLHLEDARGSAWRLDPAEDLVPTRAFNSQRAALVTDLARADPSNSALFQLYGARTLLSAPIIASGKRLGVLLVYASRAPVFANSDLELVQLLADQAAVILESRALIDAAAQVAAREEATRLKEDFLSSAAHDLKTPLTGIVAQAQVLRRRVERDPAAPVDIGGLNRLVEQSLRLKNLVVELLDVSRVEQGGLVGEREVADLRALVQAVVRREASAAAKRVQVTTAPEPVLVAIDPPRFDQVLTNLLENALKYSPGDTPIVITVGQVEGEARLSVQDHGIGIPTDDQPLVFDRFHRARNVDDRRFAGMGLGLYIVRGIVEQHGGRIWLHSTPGTGSTFYVALPGAPGPVDSGATPELGLARA